MKLDRDELALRMLEAAVGFRRPSELTAEEALACGPAALRDAYVRASVAALQYFIECAGPMTILGNPIKPSSVLSEWVPPMRKSLQSDSDRLVWDELRKTLREAN